MLKMLLFIEMEIYCFLQLAFNKHVKYEDDYQTERNAVVLHYHKWFPKTVGVSVPAGVREALNVL